jgi:hypothetical protein
MKRDTVENLENLLEELEAPIELSGEGANVGGYPCVIATFVLGIILPNC